MCVDDKVPLQASASDTDGNPLTYAWTSRDGQIAEILNCPDQHGFICFGPAMAVAPATTEVKAGEIVDFSTGGVTGGRNYGKVTYKRTASAGAVNSSGTKLQLDTTGLAPGTTVEVKVSAISEYYHCSALGSARVKIEVSGGLLQGSAIKKVSPPYPPIARAARAAGKVEVQVTISEQGEVIEAIAVSGHPLLRDAAVNAAKQWVFKPTELSGVPVKVQGILAFNFTLVDNDSQEPEIVPRSAEEYLARGKTRLAKENTQGAIADFTKAIELDQQSFDAYFQRLIARFKTNDPDGSLADANKLIEINPRSSDAYFARGSVRMLKLDLDGSIADLSKAIELNPQSALAWHFRGISRNNKRDLDGGIADLSKAIELSPFDVDAYKARGAAHWKKGDLPGAIADFDKVIDLYPDDPEAYNGRGQARQDKGDKAGALADFNKAISLDPNFGSAYFNRGSIHRDNGDHDKTDASLCSIRMVHPCVLR